MERKDALGLALAISDGKPFYRRMENDNIDRTNFETYEDWSIIVTKFDTILEKDLYNELLEKEED